MREKGHDEANIQYFEEGDEWIVLCDCGADFQGMGAGDAFVQWVQHMTAARMS